MADQVARAPPAGELLSADDPIDIDLPSDGCAEIRAQFARAIDEARRRAPRHQVQAIIAALKRAKRDALAYARRDAAIERHARRRAAMLRRIRPIRAAQSSVK